MLDFVYPNKYYQTVKDWWSERVNYYYLGNKLIAQYKNGAYLDYIHQDHLGSTVATMDADGVQTGSLFIMEYPVLDIRNILIE